MKEDIIPKDLTTAVKDTKLTILQARTKTAHLDYAEVLKLYFFVGGYIAKNTRNVKWWSGAIDASSNQLQMELPGLWGFTPTNIKNLHAFSIHGQWNHQFGSWQLPNWERGNSTVANCQNSFVDNERNATVVNCCKNGDEA